MTVKELMEILEACNPDADVSVTMWDGTGELHDYEVFHYPDSCQVVIDMTTPPPQEVKHG